MRSRWGVLLYNERDVTLVRRQRSNGFVENCTCEHRRLDNGAQRQALAELAYYCQIYCRSRRAFEGAKRLQVSFAGLDCEAKDGLAGMNDDQIRLIESSGKYIPHDDYSTGWRRGHRAFTAREGMTAMTGCVIISCINGRLAGIWVYADIPGKSLPEVRPGNTVEARIPFCPIVSLGQDQSVCLQVDNNGHRTLKAHIDQPACPTGAGDVAMLNFDALARKSACLIPTSGDGRESAVL